MREFYALYIKVYFLVSVFSALLNYFGQHSAFLKEVVRKLTIIITVADWLSEIMFDYDHDFSTR